MRTSRACPILNFPIIRGLEARVNRQASEAARAKRNPHGTAGLEWFRIGGMLRSWLAGAVLASFLILAGCTVYAERPVKAFSIATGGEGFERAFWEDIQKQDWKDLRAHLAANFVYFTPSERLDREQA